MNYYKATVKCGHVGRNHYILKSIYIKAEDGKEAALKARNTPRVKHHQKDAIKNVRLITLQQYSLGVRASANDLYFKVHNSSEQRELRAVDPIDIIDEPKEIKYRKKRNGQHIRYEYLCKEMTKQLRGGYAYEDIEY